MIKIFTNSDVSANEFFKYTKHLQNAFELQE